MLRRHTGSTLLGALASLIAAPALAGPLPVNIRAGPLAVALQDLARQTGVELLYDPAVVGGLQTKPLRGKFTPEIVLQRLLGGASLAVRRAASGAWIVERRNTPALAQPDAAVSELLIIGRRTQNFDLQRTENDVQPYQVTTAEQITHAHRDNLDQFFQSRVTSNTQALPRNLQGLGETFSEINLRGLGPEGTLVLIDGRRMGGIPGINADLHQPDLNGIPLHAIERVETLTGTSGGIYGFGALGGVVNVVLKRDYRGADLYVTTGNATRGNAGQWSLEGRIGFTPDGGGTDVMLSFGSTRSEPLRAGTRDYLARDRAATAAFAPQLLFESAPVSTLAIGNSVGVFSPRYDQKLTLKPEYGGATLNGSMSFLPLGFRGTTTDLITALAQHAGQFDPSMTDAEQETSLAANADTDSVILSARHRFGSGIEAYFDGLWLRNRGVYAERAAQIQGDHNYAFVSPNSPINPFDDSILLTFPIPSGTTTTHTDILSQRYTAGLMGPLPFGWRATAEATAGLTHYRTTTATGDAFDSSFLTFDNVGPDLNPLGDWASFQQALAGHSHAFLSTGGARARFDEQSLRLAGPVFRTTAGPATLTLLLERRGERLGDYSLLQQYDYAQSDYDFAVQIPGMSNHTISAYAELKSRLFGDDAPVPILRNLQIQLAVRHDDQKLSYTRLTTLTTPDALDAAGQMHPHLAGTAYTVGAKVSPIPRLTLRASYATGGMAPSAPQLRERLDPLAFSSAADPKRGGEPLYSGGLITEKIDGSADLKTILASTLSLGAVVNPFGDEGPRLALDYSLIRKRRDVVIFNIGDEDRILAHEDLWSDRVVRAPLTDEDRANGYTGGRITLLDMRAMNAGRSTVKTLDGSFDWPMAFAGGRLRLYAAASYHIKDVTRAPFQPDVDQTDYLLGPLRWRANGGADWVRGRMSVGFNLQFFDHYRSYFANYPEQYADPIIEAQGSKWVPSQTYLDLYASRAFRVRRGGSTFEANIEIGVTNVFDKAPARATAYSVYSGGISTYGDPRGRRFEIALSSRL